MGRKVLIISSLLGWAVALSPARAPAQTPVLASTPGQELLFSVGTRVRVANVSREGLSGDGVQLWQSPGRLHGRVGTEPVDVRLEPNRLAGSIGDHRIALDVWRAGGRLRVAGNFGERAVALSVGLDRVSAQIGPCWYDLRLQLGSYRGYVSCGGPAESVELKVPVSLVARDDREIAAMLTSLLAR